MADLSRLHWRLAEIYVDAVEKACREFGVEAGVAAAKEGNPPFPVKLERTGHPGSVAGSVSGSRLRLALVGCHGQTIYHQGTAVKFLGVAVRSTWQMGEASVIAERMRCPVVSDFRPGDLAAGGQGAPLVPMLDYVHVSFGEGEPGVAEPWRDWESDGDSLLGAEVRWSDGF